MSDVTFEALGHACADAYRAGYEAGYSQATDKVKRLLETARKISNQEVIDTIEIIDLALKELENA
jgi:hypothetical protein